MQLGYGRAQPERCASESLGAVLQSAPFFRGQQVPPTAIITYRVGNRDETRVAIAYHGNGCRIRSDRTDWRRRVDVSPTFLAGAAAGLHHGPAAVTERPCRTDLAAFPWRAVGCAAKAGAPRRASPLAYFDTDPPMTWGHACSKWCSPPPALTRFFDRLKPPRAAGTPTDPNPQPLTSLYYLNAAFCIQLAVAKSVQPPEAPMTRNHAPC